MVKTALILLSVLNGGFMLADGIYVLLNGKYIGPAKPGPWAKLFTGFNVDVFKLGPLFILFGLAWLSFALAYGANASRALQLGLLCGLLTLWYLPVGTVISMIVLILLWRVRAGNV